MRALVTIVLMTCLAACGGADLELWHTVDLEHEFSEDTAADIQTYADYLVLEERLFAEMQDKVIGRVGTGPEQTLNRYSAGSAADPGVLRPNWNRTFELIPASARGGVLLLHGMSDSPYSLRAIGQTLYEGGYRVVGLRLPGHGTIPAGLTTVRWQEMAAVTELAMSHLSGELTGKPLHIVGYSTGAALALNYALDAKEREELTLPASLVLVSPAIGISPAAALARVMRRLGALPGLEHLAWLDVMQEFDPYKYNSFAANAAEQVHRLTRRVARRVAAFTASDDEVFLPPILALKSTVDATVDTNALVDSLLARLSDDRHELVLYDINRSAVASPLLIRDPAPLTDRVLAGELNFALTLVGSSSPESTSVHALYRPAGAPGFIAQSMLDAVWPRGVVSLSHVALSFPPDDPLYGAEPPESDGHIYLGHLPLQGERGLLTIPSDFLMRLRHNPFYAHLEQRIVAWLDAASTD
ncbi:MAG: alpha/beta hydrolase [Halioglobus sp.]